MSRRLAPISTVNPAECRANPSAERVRCRKCDKTFAGGAVVNSPPRPYDNNGWLIWVMDRQLYCDHCDHIICWLEALPMSGMPQPTGVILRQPKFLRDRRRIDAFLAAYPHAAGVEQT